MELEKKMNGLVVVGKNERIGWSEKKMKELVLVRKIRKAEIENLRFNGSIGVCTSGVKLFGDEPIQELTEDAKRKQKRKNKGIHPAGLDSPKFEPKMSHLVRIDPVHRHVVFEHLASVARHVNNKVVGKGWQFRKEIRIIGNRLAQVGRHRFARFFFACFDLLVN